MMKIIQSYLICLVASLSPFFTYAVDEYTFSELDKVVTTHLYLDLAVDFKEKQLKGFVEHSLEWKDKSSSILIVDTRDLIISKVYEQFNGEWHPVKFKLGAAVPVKGAPLTIYLANHPNKIRIYYHSTPQASGLQWLSPIQTAGKKRPFMFSQSQAIHARSWIPVQDTPAMRVTYDARITTDRDLLAVMSADNTANHVKDGDYHFKMPQAIPPYLIAIGVGDLEYKEMSKQTAIYAESYIIDDAVAEFNDTQAMIDATNKIYGEYAWGRYDLLILPASFPFGGMENPRLSFITPTVVAGDKSLVNLIAHELAHSWSGNLVTNATWEDLWLNEGFTSYVENRIMEEVFGVERALMEQVLGANDLHSELKDLASDDSKLKILLKGRDPDMSFTGVPYVKGQLFLIYLEEKFGRARFDPFVKQYFTDFSFSSLTTEKFVPYLNKHLIHKYPNIVSDEKINEWIYGAGLPNDAPKPMSDVFDKVQLGLNDWLKNNKTLQQLPTDKWTLHEWLYFINHLPQELAMERIKQLDNTFDLTQSRNAEISFAWYMYSIANGYDVILPQLEKYLIAVGRRKFIVPLYKALIENHKNEWAHRVYKIARPGYHPLAQNTIDPLFSK